MGWVEKCIPYPCIRYGCDSPPLNRALSSDSHCFGEQYVTDGIVVRSRFFRARLHTARC